MSEHEDFIERLEAADLDPVSVTSPPHALTREQMFLDTIKALQCLYIAVDEPIAKDVNEKVMSLIESYRNDLTQQAQEVERLKKGCESAYALHVDDDNRLFALEQQLAAMTAERDEWQKAAQQYNGTYESLQQQLAASQQRVRENAWGDPTCHRQSPGGDCEHMIGLHGQATDEYGKPVGWCWWCWKQRQLAQLQATLAAREIRINDLEGRLAIAEYWNKRSFKEYETEMNGVLGKLNDARQDAARLREVLEEIIRQCPYGATPAERNIAKLAQRALKGA